MAAIIESIILYDVVTFNDLPDYCRRNGLQVTAITDRGGRLWAEVKEVEANRDICLGETLD